MAASDTMTVVTLPEKCAWHAVGHRAALTLCQRLYAKGISGDCFMSTWRLLAFFKA